VTCLVPMRLLADDAAQQVGGVGELLTVVQYNVQQGFNMHGVFNTRCVSDALAAVGADLVGLAEASAPRLATSNRDMTQAYAGRLQLGYFPGAPGALSSVDGGFLSRLPFTNASARTLRVPQGCDHCPTQMHLWTRATVTWGKVLIHFHSVHLEWFSDNGPQVAEIAHEIREHYAHGPLILLGTFNMPNTDQKRPSETTLRQFLEGTGLREALGAMDPDAELPLPATELVRGLHVDYIFYRGLELRNASVLGDVKCSNHLPIVASFKLPSGRSHEPVAAVSAAARAQHPHREVEENYETEENPMTRATREELSFR